MFINKLSRMNAAKNPKSVSIIVNSIISSFAFYGSLTLGSIGFNKYGILDNDMLERHLHVNRGFANGYYIRSVSRVSLPLAVSSMVITTLPMLFINDKIISNLKKDNVEGN